METVNAYTDHRHLTGVGFESLPKPAPYLIRGEGGGPPLKRIELIVAAARYGKVVKKK
jgi:hypothetical protein